MNYLDTTTIQENFSMINCIKSIFISLLLVLLYQSAFSQKATDSFSINVGHIDFDAKQDDPSFTICNPQWEFEYYNTSSYYLKHKKEIENYFRSRYNSLPADSNQTGFITIRFLINCSGATGLFRIYQLDKNYQPINFNVHISKDITSLVKSWRGWQPASYNNKIYDTYQYLTFKLKKGEIECITP
jgi:hypothetical protein